MQDPIRIAARVVLLREMFQILESADRPLKIGEFLPEKNKTWASSVVYRLKEQGLVASVQNARNPRWPLWRKVEDHLEVPSDAALRAYAMFPEVEMVAVSSIPVLPVPAAPAEQALLVPEMAPETAMALAEILHVMRNVVPDLIAAVGEIKEKMDTLYAAWFPPPELVVTPEPVAEPTVESTNVEPTGVNENGDTNG